MKSDDTLLAWWLDELDEKESEEVEAHLFECDDCVARLRELLRLRAAVKDALLQGHVAGAVSSQFIGKLRDDGLRVREYRVEAGASVACTIAPDDDVLVSCLQAPLGGIRQLDLEFETQDGTFRSTHIAFDAGANVVNVIAPTAAVKKMGVETQRMRLYAVAPGSERLVGEYTFNHSPWKMGV